MQNPIIYCHIKEGLTREELAIAANRVDARQYTNPEASCTRTGHRGTYTVRQLIGISDTRIKHRDQAS